MALKLIVRCPKCKNKMKFYCKGLPYKKTKQCVYCGYYFTVKGPRTNRIVMEIGKKNTRAKK